jgi:hypothetical protein
VARIAAPIGMAGLVAHGIFIAIASPGLGGPLTLVWAPVVRCVVTAACCQLFGHAGRTSLLIGVVHALPLGLLLAALALSQGAR